MITGDPSTFIPLVASYFGPHDSLLDVGSGNAIVGLEHWKIPHEKIWAVDIWPPNVEWKNFKLADAFACGEIFSPKSFDVVMACELIEHVEKENGPLLLAVLEQVARRLVIGTTPNGFLEQDPALSPNEPWANNPYQKHLCGWTASELIELGYCVVANAAPPADSRDIFPVGASLIFWKQVY